MPARERNSRPAGSRLSACSSCERRASVDRADLVGRQRRAGSFGQNRAGPAFVIAGRRKRRVGQQAQAADLQDGGRAANRSKDDPGCCIRRHGHGWRSPNSAPSTATISPRSIDSTQARTMARLRILSRAAVSGRRRIRPPAQTPAATLGDHLAPRPILQIRASAPVRRPAPASTGRAARHPGRPSTRVDRVRQ